MYQENLEVIIADLELKKEENQLNAHNYENSINIYTQILSRATENNTSMMNES